MKQIHYTTFGTCSQEINIELDENNTIQYCEFIGGCMGNTSGICQLVKGMSATDVISRLKGVRCGMKSTSCPDQLARALEQAL